MKRTYQPKKRKRARTHGFRARMQHTRRAADAEAAARKGPQAPDGLMDSSHPAPGSGQVGDGSRAALSSTACTARPLGCGPRARPLRVSARRRRRRPRGSGCRSRARSAGPLSATVSSGCCGRRSRTRRAPAGRPRHRPRRPPRARELAERDGLAGVARALAELLDKVPGAAARAAPAPDAPAPVERRVIRRLFVLPIRVYQRLFSPRSARAASTTRRARTMRRRRSAIRHTSRTRPRGLEAAALQSLESGGFDPVEAQRLFKPRSPVTSA